MIDAKTLKKHNLKAVPFSSIREGEWFLACCSYHNELPDNAFNLYGRRFIGDDIFLRCGFLSARNRQSHNNTTVYVPVWRVTRESHLMESWGYKPIKL
jgi:hypothetical protein